MGRSFRFGLAAALLLGCSPLALHAETSNNELAKEIAELKAQIKALRGSVAETRTETKKTNAKVRAVAEQRTPAPAPVASAFAALPEGATPVFATADKRLQFGALTITPGGYVSVTGIFRSKDLNSDTTSTFVLPTNNIDFAHTQETKLSVRTSRFALLVEAPISKDLLVAGYTELDLFTSGTTSNNIQTTSYIPRLRVMYATLDSSDYGFHVLAGQNWSLVTLNSKGITPRNEVEPPVIDGDVLAGYSYARVPQIRITKDFNKKLWLALDAEQAADVRNNGGCGNIVSNVGTTVSANGASGAVTGTNTGAVAANNNIAANTATGVAGGACLATGAGTFGGQGLNQQLSLNQVPDVLAKVAYEARIFDRDIHLEGLGIYRNFVDYVNYGNGVFATPGTSSNALASGYYSSHKNSTNGFGVGYGIIVPLIKDKLDLQSSGELGKGIGRYTSSSVPDATVNGNGEVKPLSSQSINAGLTLHATPSFDVYGFGGVDQVQRNFTVTTGGAQVGYGATGGVNNYGCETIGGTCTGQTHRVYELTAGFIDKLYKGAYGEVRVAAQYEYDVRQLFAGTTNANGIGTAAAPLRSARADEQQVFTSLRYFPFQ